VRADFGPLRRLICSVALRLLRACQCGTAWVEAAAIVAAFGSCAGAQILEFAASGFAIVPPPGYEAQPAAASASLLAISLTKPAEPGTGCRVSFEALPGFEQFTQDALNRQTDRPGWELFYREGLGEFYDVRDIDRFDHAGVRGAVVFGISKPKPAVAGWTGDTPTLIFMFYTPKGLSEAVCFAPAGVFEARRAEFEAVARGITLPR
jgi:hypothetical protein